MLRTPDAFPRDYTRRRSLVGVVFFIPALARWTGWNPAEIYVEHFDGNVGHGPRALCRTGRLPSTFRRAAGFGARRVFDEETRSAFGRAAFQSLSRTRRWRLRTLTLNRAGRPRRRRAEPACARPRRTGPGRRRERWRRRGRAGPRRGRRSR